MTIFAFSSESRRSNHCRRILCTVPVTIHPTGKQSVMTAWPSLLIVLSPDTLGHPHVDALRKTGQQCDHQRSQHTGGGHSRLCRVSHKFANNHYICRAKRGLNSNGTA